MEKSNGADSENSVSFIIIERSSQLPKEKSLTVNIALSAEIEETSTETVPFGFL